MRKTVLPRAKIMRFSGKKTDKLKKENVNVTKKVYQLTETIKKEIKKEVVDLDNKTGN